MNLSSAKPMLLLSVAAILSPLSPSFAQASDEPEQVDDIVVTATRQSQSVQKVPLSIAVFTEEDLKQKGVNTVDGLARLTPGVSVNRISNSPLGATVTIRGISGAQNGNIAGTTAVYIDDTPIQTRSIGFTAATTFPVIFDLARVEVLRGPQGTLFGASAQGGAIRFITPEPNFEGFKGSARAEIGAIRSGGKSYELGAAVGGPLVPDVLAFRASAFHRREGGFIERIPQATSTLAETNSDWTETTVARAALAWRPTEQIEITPSISYQKQFANGTGFYWEAQSNPSAHQYVSGMKIPEAFRDRFYLPALKIDVELGEVQLVSNTSYFNRKSFGLNDNTFLQAATTSGSSYLTPATAYFQSTVEQGNDQKNWTEELRLQSANPDARFNWVVGVFFSEAKQSALQRAIIPTFETYYQQVRGRTFASAFGRGLLPGGIYLHSVVSATDRQQAVFANIDFKITPQLKVSVGARYAHTSFSYDAFYDGPSNGAVAYNDTGKQSENPFTPKVALSYQATPDLLFYSSVAKGFRQGGAQQRNPTTCQAEMSSIGYDTPPTTFESDNVWSYEGGAKGRLFGGRLQFDGSLYRIDFNNIQRTITLNSCARSIVANAGDAVSEGFDLTVQTRLLRGLTLGGAIGYNKVRLKDDLFSGSVNGTRRLLISKNDNLNPRKWTGSINGEYEFPAFASFDGYVRADYTFTGRQQPGSVNNPAVNGYDPTLYLLPAYSLVNARLGIKTKTLDISLFATNLFDRRPVVSRGRFLQTNTLYQNAIIQPRVLGVTVMQNF